VYNGARVNPELIDRVLAAGEALGYRPNRIARSLRRRATEVVGVVISDIENPFFTALVRGVEDECQIAGRSVVLCNTDESLEKEMRYLQIMVDENVAGVVVAVASTEGSDLSPLLSRQTPVVAVDRRPSKFDVDAVLVDNERGAELATQHLLERGYERVACITGPAHASTAQARVRGYLTALDRHGCDLGDKLVMHADFRVDGGYAAATALLSHHEVDAIFATNNLMATGALAAIRDMGRSSPALGFVAFDEMPWANLVTPTLTTVGQPAYDIGREAARLLIERIARPNRPIQTVTLLTRLHERDSSRRARTVSSSPSTTGNGSRSPSTTGNGSRSPSTTGNQSRQPSRRGKLTKTDAKE
jgi:LacI family transcriptional regulator